MSLPEDSICRIEELEMHVENPSDIVKKKREDYAEIACLMFLPFRHIDELRGSGDDKSYWRTFKQALEEGRLWKNGIDILHNIEGRATDEKSKGGEEELKKMTIYEKPEEEDDQTNKKESSYDEDDPNAVDLSMFDDVNDREVENDFRVLEDYSQLTERTTFARLDSSRPLFSKTSTHDEQVTASASSVNNHQNGESVNSYNAASYATVYVWCGSRRCL